MGDSIVLRPLRPKVVDANPKLVEDLLNEEYRLESVKYEGILKSFI